MSRDAEMFLAELFAGQPDGTVIAVGSLQKPHFVYSPSDALGYVAGKRDVYCRVTLLAGRPADGRGTAADSTAIPGAWAEIDVNRGPRSNGKTVDDGAESVDAAIKVTHSVLEPTLIVRSGYGVHAYWLFDRPRKLGDDDARERAAALVEGWQERLRRESGIGIDSTHDLARVLRPPGSLNGKGAEPVPVVLLSSGGPRYAPERIAELAVREPKRKAPPRGAFRPAASGDYEPRDVPALLERVPKLARLVQRDGPAPGDGTPSAWDFATCCEGIRGGLDDDDLAALIRHARRGDAKGDRPDYIARTIAASRGAERSDLAGINAALAADRDPVASIIRYGTHEDATLVVTLVSSAEIRFERQSEMFSGDVIVRRASLAGLRPKIMTKQKALDVAQALIEAADLRAVSDAREEARDLMDTFLWHATAAKLLRGDLRDPDARFQLFGELHGWKVHADGYTPAAERSIVLLDTATGDRLVRVTDFAAHVREHRGRPTAWGVLHSMVTESGWRHPGELWQREPGGGRGGARTRINPYIVPFGWEDGGDDEDGTS